MSIATEEDISRLQRACSPFRTFAKSRDAAIISLLWATGLRRSELAQLGLDDLDLEARTLLVRRSKNGRSRWVPYDDRAAGHLVRYLAKRESHIGVSETALWLGQGGRPLSSDGIAR